ncbi:DedA family protein [Microbacterium sp. NPDC056234]|uniref:DedA family protein n=1 Tax=Microbacterium sp. NPDC056234 TaxID=3345757 RepID=UPI0035D7FA9C
MDDFLLWLLDAVQSVDPIARTLIAGVAVLLETSILIGLIVPGDTIVIIAAMGVTSLAEGIALGIAVVIGALIGESIGFALGRWLGPHIRHSWLGRRIGEAHWARAEIYLRRRGGLAIFLSRFLPVLHSLVPLTVGMSGYSYRRFLAWTAPACILWAAAYVSVTSLAAGSFRELVDRVHFAGYIFVGVIVLFLVVLLVGKKALAAWESRHMHEHADGDTTDQPTERPSDRILPNGSEGTGPGMKD